MRRLTMALAASLLVLVACGGYDNTAIPPPESEPEAPATTPAPTKPCGDPTRSYAPDGSVQDLVVSADVQRIRDQGRIVAGVSADSYLLGSRNPIQGRIEGFDIDLVNAIAEAIWGDAEGHVTLRVITAAERIELLEKKEIDIVARNMTINCERWESVAFSAEYYRAGQKILVRKDLADRQNPVDSVDELDGLRVCAPKGTTSLVNIESAAPDAEVVTADTHTGCLVELQQGDADAITGDDTVLAGLAAQDPYAVVPEQEAFTAEPYGIAVNQKNVDLVRLINAVLEDMRDDGSWQRSYDKWLAPTLGEGTGQPRPVYGR